MQFPQTTVARARMTVAMTPGSTLALRTRPPAFPSMGLVPTTQPGESADSCDKDRELLILVQVGPATTPTTATAPTATRP